MLEYIMDQVRDAWVAAISIVATYAIAAAPHTASRVAVPFAGSLLVLGMLGDWNAALLMPVVAAVFAAVARLDSRVRTWALGTALSVTGAAGVYLASSQDARLLPAALAAVGGALTLLLGGRNMDVRSATFLVALAASLFTGPIANGLAIAALGAFVASSASKEKDYM